jgi:hypothetical protein
VVKREEGGNWGLEGREMGVGGGKKGDSMGNKVCEGKF